MIIAYCRKCRKRHQGPDFGVLMENEIVECPACSADGNFHMEEMVWEFSRVESKQ